MQNATIAKIALSAVVLLGGGSFLIYSSVSHAQHYRMVDALVGEGLDQWKDKELKVHGWIEAGSITENIVNQEQQRSFVLQKEGKKIRVFHKGPKPDTFKDQSEVVATGRLIPAKDMAQLATDLCKANSKGETPNGCPIQVDAEQAWVVDSTDLMAKCPSKYNGAPSIKLDPTYK